MKKNLGVKRLTIMVVAALILGGAGHQVVAAEVAETGVEKESVKRDTVYVGKITGVSKKAKSISMTVGKGDKAKMVMVKFTDQTTGMEHAKKGEAAIISYESQGQEKIALSVKPKLAKLPAGVSEMQPEELVKLVQLGPENGNYFLVDSRPAKRYAAGHVPTAVSLPVGDFKERVAEILPSSKDFPLIFHCGGPT